MPEEQLADGRIAVMPASLADQIAAGEVVERPGSIVKELVDNAIDAGATRVEVELEAGGSELIRVIDDGGGIHREDLPLALRRHATSKLRTAAQLVEIHTLGFRGEALASISAVARVELRSRVAGQAVGHRLRSTPDSAPRIEPIGMPFGTQIEVGHLFASVPARRKFLRSEATEVGHCVDAVISAAIVHPRVQFRVRHGGRELLEFAAGDQTSRVIAVLQRRGGAGPFVHFSSERQGVTVQGWFAPPSAATRQRSASFVVVRRRVVRERTLGAALKQAYADALPRGTHPVACLFVEPPRGTVDVNVHPQKSEVRFSSPQLVYAVVRELVDEGLAAAAWRREPGRHDDDSDGDPIHDEAAHAHGWARVDAPQAGAQAALAGWSRREGLSGAMLARDGGAARDQGGGGGYRLGTRAAGGDYRANKQEFRSDVERLRASLTPVDRDRARGAATLPFDEGGHADPLAQRRLDRAGHSDEAAPEPDSEPRPEQEGPRLLTCLPGAVALFEFRGELLVADLRRIRAHLVRRRLLSELAATTKDGRAPAQGLLQPVVVPRVADDRQQLLAAGEALARLGLELEGFGDDAVLVRAVPAVLPSLLDAEEVGRLLDRLMPWLRMRGHADVPEAEREGFVEAVAEHASARSIDVNPRVAKRWLADLLADLPARDRPSHAGQSALDQLPGLRRWSATELLG
ncbi:DNA mismatch repair protein MutL [Enhygromyxa salina]|uniref:DNA mismatch repair protein MutL n=1 Tax=Enhygromyxa salina TaxID=215803 RepID=A0A0C1ZBK2_9BACT|nr:DNA mismatch repair endonuclease MutL [Enhygromyxa salina]KIG15099.1 DNA mismatch repair protein MutL [Enhygromyxa salina]